MAHSSILNFWQKYVRQNSEAPEVFYEILFSYLINKVAGLKKGVLKNFAQFLARNLFWSVFFNKLHARSLQFYEKTDPGTGLLPLILAERDRDRD